MNSTRSTPADSAHAPDKIGVRGGSHRIACPEARRTLRALLLGVAVSIGGVPIANAQLSVGIGISSPGVNVGIDIGAYPRLVPVPGYPVYYAPDVSGNYFFYEGRYWVFAGGNWYASGWYNGPWQIVAPQAVPLYVLRVPVGYYRLPPPMFRGWRRDAPPHWGEQWGHEWEARHRGWDQWDHKHAARPAPLPVYQQRYAGDRYPRDVKQQQAIRVEHGSQNRKEQGGGPKNDGHGNGSGNDQGNGNGHGKKHD